MKEITKIDDGVYTTTYFDNGAVIKEINSPIEEENQSEEIVKDE